MKGKWMVKSVDDSQLSVSKGERNGRYSLHSKTNKDQRKRIFIIKCMFRKEVISVIVDGGSCKNMVSEELVKRARLKKYKVKAPYNISWFKKGGEITVKYKCLVPIQLKGYKDEVWCDVVPMDACHVLLERLWKFDRQAIHDGRQKTYTIVKRDKRHIFWPTGEDKVVPVVLSTK